MREIVQPALQSRLVDEQRCRLRADHIAVAKQVNLGVVLPARHGRRQRNMYAKQGRAEELDTHRSFTIETILYLVADQRLKERYGIVMADDFFRCQIGEPDAVTLQGVSRGDCRERPGAGEIVV